ncbi:MAG: PKD domain-containing protein, partial [Thermoplasmata archaeon]|nr:PKD domain-containing protein [Thermoplasmata archaeon]
NGEEVKRYGEYANFIFEIPGYYNCTLMVIDEIGNTAFTNFNLTVFDIEIPICDAGRDLVALNGENITFDGSGSKDNSRIVHYEWNFTYQDIEQIFYEEIFSFNFITPGVYMVFLTVWDLFGNLDRDIMNVTIIDTILPIAVINGSTGLLVGESLFLDAIQSTDNGRIINYTWNFTYQDEEQKFYRDNFSFYFISPGEYKVYLTVWDQFGNQDQDMRLITITDIHPPVAVVNGSTVLLTGDRLILDALKSTDNGRIAKYQWNFNDIGPNTILGPLLDYEIINVGDLEVSLTIWDEAGLMGSTYVYITFIDTHNPFAIAGEEIIAMMGDTVVFNGSASTDDGRIVKYQWDFIPDQEVVRLFGETAEYIFKKAGVYGVTLTVFDQSGNFDESNFIVIIQGAGNLEGRITSGGKPVAEAECLLTYGTSEVTIFTNSDGWFYFIDIPTGPVHLQIKKDGYLAYEEDNEIPSVGTASIDSSQLELEKEESDLAPNYFVIFGLILMVLIIIGAILFMVIRFARNTKDEETHPPEE